MKYGEPGVAAFQATFEPGFLDDDPLAVPCDDVGLKRHLANKTASKFRLSNGIARRIAVWLAAVEQGERHKEHANSPADESHRPLGHGSPSSPIELSLF